MEMMSVLAAAIQADKAREAMPARSPYEGFCFNHLLGATSVAGVFALWREGCAELFALMSGLLLTFGPTPWWRVLKESERIGLPLGALGAAHRTYPLLTASPDISNEEMLRYTSSRELESLLKSEFARGGHSVGMRLWDILEDPCYMFFGWSTTTPSYCHGSGLTATLFEPDPAAFREKMRTFARALSKMEPVYHMCAAIPGCHRCLFERYRQGAFVEDPRCKGGRRPHLSPFKLLDDRACATMFACVDSVPPTTLIAKLATDPGFTAQTDTC